MSSAFVPQYSLIESIASVGQTTVVTFTADCDFSVGEIVSFRISPPYGMTELNNVQSRVSSVTSDTITLNIDSSNFTRFVIPPQDLPITGISVDTPVVGYTRVTFSDNTFLDNEVALISGVTGSIAQIINNITFRVSNCTTNTVDIELNSTGYIYTSGGIASIFPISLLQEVAMVVPSGSGILLGNYPAQTNLQDVFDNVPTN